MMKNRPRLLMCDIDGTLVEKGGTPQGKTRRILEIFHDEGILLGLASGRPVDQRTINRFRTWGFDFDPDIVIGVNGCEVWELKDKVRRKYNYLPKEMTRKILDYMWPLDINVCAFEDGYDRVLARRKDAMIEESKDRNRSNIVFCDKERFCLNDIPKLEFHYVEDKFEDVISDLLEKHKDEGYVWTKSYDGTLEFMLPGVDKGLAMEKFCRERGIPLEEVIACGDMDNDITMLQKAGTGICLLNGSEKTKEAADYVTEKDVSHDGLGEFLFEYLGIE